MYFQLDLINLFCYVFQVIIVDAITSRIGIFDVPLGSQELKECAYKILSTQYPKDFRVSKSWRQCEYTTDSWDEEDMEPGYDYAKLTYIQEAHTFLKPILIKSYEEYIWDFPGDFTTGTRVSLYVTWPIEDWDMILYGPLNQYGYSGSNFVSIRIHDKRIFVREHSHIYASEVYFGDNAPGTHCNITFVAYGNNTIKIVSNGIYVTTWVGQTIRFDTMNRLTIVHNNKRHDTPFVLHGTDFIQG